MRTFLSTIGLSLFMFGCSAFAPSHNDEALRSLRRAIDVELSDSLFIPSNTSLKVVSLQSGQTLYSRNSKLLFRPASNTKLFTSAAALCELGTSFAFRTVILADSFDAVTGKVKNIILKGYGDPDLRSVDIDSLSAQLYTLGVRTVQEDIIADATFFDDQYWGPGWMTSQTLMALQSLRFRSTRIA
jgi:D-alanyl-D-alanine carboxypeptidase/D-alanyl-D-alanine-endopeptidase (penicillin-binding protein 4)